MYLVGLYILQKDTRSIQYQKEGDKVVSPTYRLPLRPRKYSCNSFLEAESTHSAVERIRLVKSSIERATLLLVAQCLNEMRYRVRHTGTLYCKKLPLITRKITLSQGGPVELFCRVVLRSGVAYCGLFTSGRRILDWFLSVGGMSRVFFLLRVRTAALYVCSYYSRNRIVCCWT